jgi:two-component system, NarL family, invasion response regulator UvrY
VIRVLIADDHAVVRHGLKRIVSAELDMAVAGEAQNGDELLALARAESADIIVMDITMPGKTGLEALKVLRKEHPRLPVLVLSMHPENQYAVRALKSGAAGYLTKDSAPEELVKAIRKIVQGGRYVSGALAERLAMGLGGDDGQPQHERLSQREYQVMCLLASGKSTSEIAETLNLSVKTVSSYRARILEKMAMKGNGQLTRYAIENQLVS